MIDKFIGIDPGKKGAICVLSKNKIEFVSKMDDDSIIGFFKARDGFRHALCIEKVHSMPNDGKKSAYSFGYTNGFIHGVIKSNNFPLVQISPQKWKKEFDLIGKDKLASIEACKRLFPGVDLRRTTRCTTDSDGMAEALLIAEYCRRDYCGEIKS